ncbi:membrane protein [Alteromonas sp. I4]|nr:membrane protein [Alteromonas sp. I4]
MAFKSDDDKTAYWKENLSLLAKLLVIWFVVSFGCGILFVDVLNNIQFFGFKLGFWFAQQGAIYVFVALIFVYMAKMNAMDKKYGVDEE